MSTKTALIMTHHIFLTKEQRYALSKPDDVVDVIGVSSPVWVKNGKWSDEDASEIFCRYQVKYVTQPEKNTVRIQRDGYIISLANGMPAHLLDPKDGGSMSLMLTHRNFIKKGNNKPVTVIHCVSIEDMHMLEDSLA